MTRVRADALLVTRKLAGSRTEAQALIMAGKVTSGPRRIDKPGTLLPEDAEVHVASGPRFVSRGGDKLEHALAAFAAQHGLDVAGKTCVDVGASTGGFTDCLLQRGAARGFAVDVGASTGGFTDCLLQRGAARVWAVDVGHNQLHYRIRTDPRVVVREGVNARALTPEMFPSPFEGGVVDVSFISLRTILPALVGVLAKGAPLVCLVKPQFEVGKGEVGKGGVVRDDAKRVRVLAEVREAAGRGGFTAGGSIESPVAGATGNREFLLLLRKQ